MIRISIFFFPFLFLSSLFIAHGQNEIEFTCIQRDSISWELNFPVCPTYNIDSFQVLVRSTKSDPFVNIHTERNPSKFEFQNEDLKTSSDLYLKYYMTCNEKIVIDSDTLPLSAIRNAVELDSVLITEEGDVRLSWEKIPVKGINYTVMSIIDGSSQPVSGKISQTSFEDTRKLADKNKIYYTISAFTSCGYTFPEPDSFFHTSYLRGNTEICKDEISFEYDGFSYWKAGKKSRTLIVEENGKISDSVQLDPEENIFTYKGLKNNTEYQFYVIEKSHKTPTQVARSNIVNLYTDFYESIQWIVTKSIDFDAGNNLIISWETNPHPPYAEFWLKAGNISREISDYEISKPDQAYKIDLAESVQESLVFSLNDSCGNTISSKPKIPLFTTGNFAAGTDLNIQWPDIRDEEWSINRYRIFYKTENNYSELAVVDAKETHYHHTFDHNTPLDSICYYIIAEGSLFFTEIDSTTTLNIQSNTVCLYGETVISIPNAFYVSGNSEYKPIIAPKSNISRYRMIIFDRYGNNVFETENMDQGWRGNIFDSAGNSDVYIVFIEVEDNQGEHRKEFGSLLLLR